MLSEAKSQGSSSLPGLLGFSMGIVMNGFSLALASGILMVTSLRPLTFSLERPLPSRSTSHEKCKVLPNKL